MDIGGYEFTGPVTDVASVPLDGRGVYVVVDLVDGEVDGYLDIGEARQLGDALRLHDRKTCWHENATGDLGYCYRITSGEWDRDLAPNPLEQTGEHATRERFGIVSELTWKLDFPCCPNSWQEIEEFWALYQEYEDEFGPREASQTGESETVESNK